MDLGERFPPRRGSAGCAEARPSRKPGSREVVARARSLKVGGGGVRGPALRSRPGSPHCLPAARGGPHPGLIPLGVTLICQSSGSDRVSGSVTLRTRKGLSSVLTVLGAGEDRPRMVSGFAGVSGGRWGDPGGELCDAPPAGCSRAPSGGRRGEDASDRAAG